MCLLQPVTTVPMLLLSLRSRHCSLCVASGLALTARFTQAHPTMYWLIFFCLFTLAFKGLVALTRTVTHTHRHTHRHTHTHTQHTRHTQKPYKMVEKGLDQVVNKYHQNTDSNNYIHTTETIHNVEKKDKLAKFLQWMVMSLSTTPVQCMLDIS